MLSQLSYAPRQNNEAENAGFAAFRQTLFLFFQKNPEID
jgi:hypothetical protein